MVGPGRKPNPLKHAVATLAVGLLGALITMVTTPQPVVAAEIVTIEWHDLMPPGEYELLEELHGDYLAKLELRMRANQDSEMSLSDSLSLVSQIEEGSEFDGMEQIGTFNVVNELDGKTVRIPGFIVPLDFDPNDIFSDFLFVPYFGACIHTPPPPPNQIIYVTLDRPGVIRGIHRPLWIEGVLSTQRNETDLGSAAYSLHLSKVELYEG
jgi:uncharacterized protein